MQEPLVQKPRRRPGDLLITTDLRATHEHNDEVLESIYIGRRFRNDTERLEKLFDLYTKMIGSPGAAAKRKNTGASA